MNVILGASGQVGSAIVGELLRKKLPVTGVVRDTKKADDLRKRGAAVEVADAFDLPALQSALREGTVVFVLTPETGKSEDVLGDTRKILANYRAAIEASPVKKIVGLSSLGAQNGVGSGNLEMSFLVEHAFDGMTVQRIFVRPAYYYSNWLPYLASVKEHGVLPTFYPVGLKIPMVSPLDVAQVVADVMTEETAGSPIYEVEGPDWYNSSDVAAAFGEALGHRVEAQQIPKENWGERLHKIGFTEDAVKNFIKMTDVVISGKAGPEKNGTISVKTSTPLKQYLASQVSS